MLGGGAWLSCLGELCVPLVDAWSSQLFELMLIADALQINCRVAGYDNKTCNARCRFPRNLQCKVSVPQISTDDTSATSPSLTPLPGLCVLLRAADGLHGTRLHTTTFHIQTLYTLIVLNCALLSAAPRYKAPHRG